MKQFLLAITLLLSITSFAQSLETDRLALIALYNSTNGAGWTNKTGWNVPGTVGESPCGWYGVTCGSGRVNGLSLSNNNLTGTLPNELGNLMFLKKLYVQDNLINGSIPNELSNLSNLEDLLLYSNQLSGALPSDIGNLSSLKYLALQDNNFTGPLPSSLGNLSNIIILNLDGSEITGTIPTSLGNLSNLEGLFLSDNKISGSIPPEIGALTNIKSLYLSRNQLDGDIPSELGNLSNLINLILNDNKLSGSIPSQVDNLSSLKFLSLYNNELSGPVPILNNISSTAYVYISNNNFTFEGMESNISKLDSYSPQGKIPIASSGSTLSVNAGGTMSNNTYRWYKNGALVATNVGTNSYTVSQTGIYRVEVTNSIASGLTLISEDLNFQALPVTLVNFTGKHAEGRNILRWSTTAETNNAGFEIQRSNDAHAFVTIGFTDGKGQPVSQNHYQFTDNEPFKTSYYRLKQIDYDGKSDLSRIIAISSEIQQLKVFPNPAKDAFTVESSDTESPLHVYNMKGATIHFSKGAAVQPISTTNWPTGIYVIQIGDKSEKVVIDK